MMTEAIETWISMDGTATMGEKSGHEASNSPSCKDTNASFNLMDECSAVFCEWRHNTCLMTPVCALILVAIAMTSLVTLICSIPQFVLGLFLGPLIKRSSWLVEFLYPIGFVGRASLWFMRFMQRRQTAANTIIPHSRAVEHRFQVLHGRVYVHTIPVLLDNFSYLIVFCLLTDTTSTISAELIGYIIDCGDAEEVMRGIDRLRFFHYEGRPITIRAILSTHKHHDHTGGNQKLLQTCYPETITHVYGGAIERVPMCTDTLKNGDRVPVPNELKGICEIEVIATPSHTRGSIVYALRCCSNGLNKKMHDTTVQIFTGDVMFSAGGGLPFEADVLLQKDKDTALKPSAGMNSIERCFAEIMFRVGVPSDHVAVFPGHEYTVELLRRQFDAKVDCGKFWYKLAPSVFFETASHYFVAQHKRTLPRGKKLLTAPSLLQRELKINPHFRSLVHRGGMFMQAVHVWKQFYEEDVAITDPPLRSQRSGISVIVQHKSHTDTTKEKLEVSASSLKRPSSSYGETQKIDNAKASWTITNKELKHNVFCTVYSAELDDIIRKLQDGDIGGPLAANKLMEMRRKLDEQVVSRKPAPNTSPTDGNKKLILLAIAMLGSGPTAMTPSDAVRMNLPQPVSNPEKLVISKNRLLNVLVALGILSNLENSREEIQAIDLLWQVSQNRDLRLAEELQEKINSSRTNYSSVIHASAKPSGGNLVVPSDDTVELGILKATLFGPSKPPFWAGLCYPCHKDSEDKQHPVLTSTRRQSGAELILHEVEKCNICKESVVCFHLQSSKVANGVLKASESSFDETKATVRGRAVST